MIIKPEAVHYNVAEAVSLEELLKEKEGRYSLDIVVKPGSKKQGLGAFDPWRKRFVVQVKAPAQKGKANTEVARVIAKALGVKEVVIESGHTSHSKTVSFLLGEAGFAGLKGKLEEHF